MKLDLEFLVSLHTNANNDPKVSDVEIRNIHMMYHQHYMFPSKSNIDPLCLDNSKILIQVPDHHARSYIFRRASSGDNHRKHKHLQMESMSHGNYNILCRKESKSYCYQVRMVVMWDSELMQQSVPGSRRSSDHLKSDEQSQNIRRCCHRSYRFPSKSNIDQLSQGSNTFLVLIHGHRARFHIFRRASSGGNRHTHSHHQLVNMFHGNYNILCCMGSRYHEQ
jgi:hypothetical protein